jgi:hypothetical protein
VTAPTTKEPGTAMERATKRELSPEVQAKVDEMQLRNRVATAIRGQVWSKDLDARQIQALAQYCRENQLDAVRHVEVLGGRIYLTAEFYDERGADLLRSGEVVPAEPDYINADPRLEEMAAKGDEWAKGEKERRLRERIKWAVPEKAAAAVVQRFHIAANGRAVVGVNWCGGGSRQRDPVGEAEPTKTAQTRARRRAWKQIADVIPSYGAVVRPIEENARPAICAGSCWAPSRMRSCSHSASPRRATRNTLARSSRSTSCSKSGANTRRADPCATSIPLTIPVSTTRASMK